MRWRLLPALDSTAIKTLGLILYLPTVAWLLRVDGFLFRHVVPALEHGVPMTGGPYRRVRHPRHAGLFFTRLWWLLIERRIRRDERYLRARVGSAYDLRAAKTPQLIPAVRLHR
jgi:protein-S-isoprenylcysteine O-methyltransferase Ste14